MKLTINNRVNEIKVYVRDSEAGNGNLDLKITSYFVEEFCSMRAELYFWCCAPSRPKTNELVFYYLQNVQLESGVDVVFVRQKMNHVLKYDIVVYRWVQVDINDMSRWVVGLEVSMVQGTYHVWEVRMDLWTWAISCDSQIYDNVWSFYILLSTSSRHQKWVSLNQVKARLAACAISRLSEQASVATIVARRTGLFLKVHYRGVLGIHQVWELTIWTSPNTFICCWLIDE